jgi:putative glutamine amidotransferase
LLGDYLEALTRAGAEPRVIDAKRESPDEALEHADGLLLTGGGDIDPARYGEATHPTTHEIDRERDAYEVALVNKAIEEDLPILAICRGIQILNVARGGDLVQDIPSAIPNAVEHSVPTTLMSIAHDVRPVKGSLLWKVTQEKQESSDACPVNSRHHQSVGRLASGFEVSATAPDGVIEAIERRAAKFCLGVQWHPENFWRTGEFRALFEAFATACAK